MKRQSYQRHSYYSERSPRMVFIALGGILLLGALAATRWLAPGVLTALATPVWSTGSYLSTSVGNAVPQSSQEEVRKLQNENAALVAQNASLASRLEGLHLLTGSASTTSQGIPASVLIRPPVTPYDVLVISTGSEAGIRAGAFVYGPGGTPVGRIQSVSGGSSRVLLFSAGGVTTQAWAGVGRVPITLMGIGSGAFETVAPREAGLGVGDSVYIATDQVRPIGTIIRIDADPSAPNAVLNIKPYTNPFSLTWVTVGLE